MYNAKSRAVDFLNETVLQYLLSCKVHFLACAKESSSTCVLPTERNINTYDLEVFRYSESQ